MQNVALERGLPSNLEAEKLVLGSVLLDDTNFPVVAGGLGPDDFTTEAHRRIFSVMQVLCERGERIDRITVSNELLTQRKLETVGGLSYLVTLDDGLPRLYNLDSYIRLIKDKAIKRRLAFAANNILNEALMDQRQGDVLVQEASDRILGISQELPGSDLLSAMSIIENYPGGLQGLLDQGTVSNGVRSGFRTFDELTGGFQPGELSIIAARPGAGKTAMALNIAAYAAVSQRKAVAIFSLEMSRVTLMVRMITAAGRVDSQKVRGAMLNQDERRRLSLAATDIVESKLYIDDSATCSVMDILSKLRRLKMEQGLDLAIIDYLQLMDTGRRADNRNQELGIMTRGLKLAAKDLNVPIVTLSQLSRGPETREDHRPRLSDLRESGNIEQDADVVAFIFREEYYKPDREDLRGLADLILAKQRNGPTGTAKLVFLRDFTLFANRAELDVPEEAE